MALAMAERIERPPSLLGDDPGSDREPRSRRPHGDVGGGPTLDDVIVGAWEGLTAHRAVACPLCDEGMLRPRLGRNGVEDARCDRCGATLA
jgi:hypothetical protein